MKNKIVIRKIPAITLCVILATTVLFTLGILFNVRLLTITGLFCLFFYLIVSISKESYLATAFLISFFTFLLGRILVNAVTGEQSLLTGAFIYGDGPTDDELWKPLTLFFVSLVTFSIGVLSVPRNKNALATQEEKTNFSLEQICIIMFYLTIAFELVVSAERFVFLYASGSYTSYYTSFARHFPSVLYKIAELNSPAFFSVLAFAPKKKKIKPIIALYLLDGFIVLLAGQRNQFVRSALICFCYILLRNKWDNEEKWLSKAQIRIVICALPFAVIALQAWGTIRNGDAFTITNILGTIFDFFKDQGTTSAVVYEGIKLQDSFPKGTNYTFAPIINFFTNNQITKLFFQTKSYAQGTRELALYGNNFGATLTYLYMSYNYLAGIGMGTSYISEVFHDFGWVGICIINILYGVVLVRLERYLSKPIKSPWLGMVLLLFADGILYAPRDSAFNFLTNAINFTVLLYVVLVYVLSTLLKGRKPRKIRWKN